MAKMISDQFVQNAWALGDRWRSRRKEKKIQNAMAGWNENPDMVIQEVFGIDRNEGMALKNARAEELAKQAEVKEAKRKIKMETMGKIGSMLEPYATKSPEEIGRAIDSLGPILTNTLEMAPEEIAMYRGAFMQNPALLKQLTRRPDAKYIQAAPGTQILDPDDPSRIVHQVPYTPVIKEVTNETGGTDVIPINVNNLGGGGATGAEGGTSSITPLNPGAIKDSPFAQAQPGYQGSRSGFAVFATPEHGRAAQKTLLASYVNRGFDTPEKIINRWAPVGGENSQESVSNYIGYVSQRAGIAPDQPIPAEKLDAVATAMAEFESGARPGGGKIKPVYSTKGKPTENKGSWRQLSAAEVEERGLNPNARWQIGTGVNNEGETKIIGPAGLAKGPEQSRKALASVDMALQRGETLVETLKKLRDHRGLSRITGPVMGRLPDLTGDAADAEAIRSAGVAQTAGAALVALREAAANGSSGLGNTNIKDLELLEKSAGSMDRLQTTQQFKQEVQRSIDIAEANVRKLRETKARVEREVARQTGGGGGGSQSAAAPKSDGVNAPEAHKEYLRKNPTGPVRLQFDQKYGRGAAKKVLGSASVTTDMPRGVKTAYGTRI